MEIVNVAQAEAWDGEEGSEWARHAARFDRSTRRHWERLAGSGVIGHGDRVLDVGCGTGRSTRAAARLTGSGHVLGVDLSAAMLDVARTATEAEGLTNVTYQQADAQVEPFTPGGFDVVLGVYSTMFFGDAAAGFANLADATRSGGRLALLVWRELARNEWLTEIRGALAVGRTLPEPPPNAPSPFGLADPAYVRSVLEPAGFGDVGFEEVDDEVDFGPDAGEAYSFLSELSIFRPLLTDLDGTDRATALKALRATVDAHDTAHGVLFNTSGWLITAVRR